MIFYERAQSRDVVRAKGEAAAENTPRRQRSSRAELRKAARFKTSTGRTESRTPATVKRPTQARSVETHRLHVQCPYRLSSDQHPRLQPSFPGPPSLSTLQTPRKFDPPQATGHRPQTTDPSPQLVHIDPLIQSPSGAPKPDQTRPDPYLVHRPQNRRTRDPGWRAPCRGETCYELCFATAGIAAPGRSTSDPGTPDPKCCGGSTRGRVIYCCAEQLRPSERQPRWFRAGAAHGPNGSIAR